jgi:hypothetical protein
LSQFGIPIRVGVTSGSGGKTESAGVVLEMPAACRVAVATVRALVCAFALAPVASAQQAPPPAEGGKPPLAAAWPAKDIEAARARCGKMLEGLDLEVLPHDPVREGSECGTPAPVQLVSIGSDPQISFAPPALLTCEMVAALHRWLEREVQPLARRHLGAPVVRIATMSSFSCRMAKATGRLSEHGRVNALDIGAFLTAEGETALVLADWGPIAREEPAKPVAANPGAATEAKNARTKGQRPPPVVAGITLEHRAVTFAMPPPGIAAGLAPPTRLGGPKARDAGPAEASSGKALFLRGVHRTACGIFATVLGPEANKAHKNHFHVDMAARKNGPFCE